MTWFRVILLVLVLYALSRFIVACSPLGLLNFLVLQWFGVRLGRKTLRGRSSNGDTTTIESEQRWVVARWIWPLTGWWSKYRYIRRRRTP